MVTERHSALGATRVLAWLAPLAVLAFEIWYTAQPTEPFFNNDETRHLMTGVFFRDMLVDGGWRSPRDYAVQYYLQYPVLGLLVWPPLFYLIEGAVMLVFGTSLLVGKLLVVAFAVMACGYLFALVSRTHDRWTATVASLFFVLSPLVLEHSRQVMLEIPALAFMMAALYHAVVHLETERRLHLWLAGFASAAAVLTRFDAAVIAPGLLLVLWLRRDWRVAFRRETWFALVAAGLVTLPVVWLTVTEFGAVHLSTIVPADAAQPVIRRMLSAALYYPRSLPDQLGWFVLVPALLGTIVALASGDRRRPAAPYLAMIAATYVTFSAIDEKVPRHSLAWVPAFAALAAYALSLTRGRWLAGRPFGAEMLVAAVIISTAVGSWQTPAPYVRGYAAAAEYVVSRTSASRFVLFDGFLDGDFTYQVRRRDPGRKLWVLRGDKVFYASVINRGAGYTEFVKSDREMEDVLFSYDPEYIVVESPQVGDYLPMAERLRTVLATHPERYVLEKQVPVESNHPLFRQTTLLIYRSVVRNPWPRTTLELEMLTLGRRVGEKRDVTPR